MKISSMTGFARTEGTWKDTQWVWEIRSVNGRGLDMRMRLGNGFDKMDPDIRAAIKRQISRGSLTINLNVQQNRQQNNLTINRALFAEILDTARELAQAHDIAPPDMNALLNVRGIIDVLDPEEDAEEHEQKQEQVKSGLLDAIEALVHSRMLEGEKLRSIMVEILQNISEQVEQAERIATTQPQIIKAKLTERLQELLGENSALEPERIAQEVTLLAAKADVREEIDRLRLHVKAAYEIIEEGGAIGRKLDFLVQEFNRETNTLCSKSSDSTLTNIGLSLKTLIEQLREQAQNIE
ncbi:MAG: YicC family protein [Kordiimonas sp.]|nr:YicC family protein [Kordiimonas sp.]|tara:strand:+ start:481 stop:1368 length:888 start_codon:yes stop_codon:yes gene_type:complete